MSAGDKGEALIDERELAAALRGLRVAPEDFRAAVERRLREAEAESAKRNPSDERTALAAAGGWWRRAAAWLPAELVPTSLAGAGAKLSWKALPGLLALPALTFAMVVLPVFLAFQTLGSRGGERAEERLAIVRGWWRQHRRAALFTLAVIGLVFLLEPASAGVALLLVSTGVLAVLLARLRAAGFGRRADVARHCANLLFALSLWMAMLGEPWQALFPDERATKLGFGVLALGSLVCAALSLGARYASLWQLLKRAGAGDAALLVQVVVFTPWSALVVWDGLTGFPSKIDRVQAVELLRPRGNQWEEARKSVAWMRHEGLAPDLAGLRAHWLQHRSTGVETDDVFLAAGVDLGFVEEQELALVAAEARALLREDGPLRGASLRERADLLALVRHGTLTEAEREHLARRLLASRDAGATPWVIERLGTVAALLDELGLPQLADELRPDAHALLAESWVADDALAELPSRRPGFFARRWQPGDESFHRHTHDALDLMLRFGVPEGIDLAGVGL